MGMAYVVQVLSRRILTLEPVAGYTDEIFYVLLFFFERHYLNDFGSVLRDAYS